MGTGQADDARPTWVIAPKVDAAIPPSGATPVAMPATGTPGIPANARTSRNCDATHASAAVDSPALSIPPHASTTGSTPVMPNKKEYKLGLQLRERDDRTGNRGEHVLNQRDDVRN